MCGTGISSFSPGNASVPPAIFSGTCDALPLSKQKNRVDCIWVVNVIGRDARGIGSAARLCEKHFVKEAAFLDVTGEHFSLVDVLIADR